MKHLIASLSAVLTIIALLLLIENIIDDINYYTLIPSIIYLIIIFALVSFGNEKK